MAKRYHPTLWKQLISWTLINSYRQLSRKALTVSRCSHAVFLFLDPPLFADCLHLYSFLPSFSENWRQQVNPSSTGTRCSLTGSSSFVLTHRLSHAYVAHKQTWPLPPWLKTPPTPPSNFIFPSCYPFRAYISLQISLSLKFTCFLHIWRALQCLFKGLFEECFNIFVHTLKVSGVQNNFGPYWLSLHGWKNILQNNV